MDNILSIILLYATMGVLSIDLHLPLAHEDRHLFNEVETVVDNNDEGYRFGVCNRDIYYKSLNDESITRVFYKDFQLFNDTSEPEPRRQLIVSYSEFNGRVFIRAFYEYNIYRFEGGYYIVNDHVFDLLRITNLMSKKNFLINGLTPGEILTSIFYRLDSLNKLLTDENPQGSDVVILRDKVPVSPEIIAWEINNIYRMKLIRKSGLYQPRANLSTV